MKEWTSSHPKASLLARKRAAILEAARSAFLTAGYEGTSMEAIAAAAGVSIMTLYRHAKSKDGLFAAVMLNECERAHTADEAAELSLEQPLRDLLIQIGMRFQERLADPDIVSLFRVVMVETVRFPHVAEAAYSGFIGSWEREIMTFLDDAVDCAHMGGCDRTSTVRRYIDDLIGADLLRALFGLPPQRTPELERRRSEVAADSLIASVHR